MARTHTRADRRHGADPLGGVAAQADLAEHAAYLRVAARGLGPLLHGDVVREREGAEPAGEPDLLREVSEPADAGALSGNHRIQAEHADPSLRRSQRARE